MVEHGTENAGVDSSSLSLGTFIGRCRKSGSGSVVEHLLAKERVASSNLVFRSMYNNPPILCLDRGFSYCGILWAMVNI